MISFLNLKHQNKIFSIAFAVVLVRNWFLWRQDKKLADRLLAERKPIPTLSRMPKVSVLVAAWNEQKNIEAHIQSFLALQYKNIELVLCAGGSDNTFSLASKYAKNQIIVIEQQAGEGKQSSLARCMKYASGEIIYLTDADCIYNDEALIRLLAPLVIEGEQVATGSSRPLDKQLNKVLPLYIWSSDVVVNMRSSNYSEGLLGRNAMVTRMALERIGGMNFPAQTGTDYHLAKLLIKEGFPIRYVRDSIIASEYPVSLGAYRRKQSRWLRNLLLYGPRYHANRDLWLTLKTVGVGIIMLFTPLTTIFLGNKIMLPWLVLLIHATCSRLRYTLFTFRLYKGRLPFRLLTSIIPLVLLDFVIWTLPVLDLLSTKKRKQW